MPGSHVCVYVCYPAIVAISYLYTLKTRGLLTFSGYQLGDFAQNALFNGFSDTADQYYCILNYYCNPFTCTNSST